MGRLLLVFAAIVGSTALAGAQSLPPADADVTGLAPADRAATLTYANRPIVTLRAHVLARMPSERVSTAAHALDRLVARGSTAPVSTRPLGDSVIVTVAGEGVLAIVPDDADRLAGESAAQAADAVAARLRIALPEAAELRAPATLLRGVVAAVAATVVLLAALWGLRRLERTVAAQIARGSDRWLGRTWHGQAMRATHLPHTARSLATLLLAAAALALSYLWLTFVLRRFPYTRPWGESLRARLLERAGTVAAAFVDALPGLLTVAVILVSARAAARAVALLFEAVEHGRASLPGVYPDTAAAARRLVVALLWLLALAMAYPYVPGSETSGFKGISVFVGVIISLGSTGVMQHLMSGLMMTFARAVHIGDYARIGEVEGTVVQLGALATKVRTRLGEEITIPNAVVVAQTTTNYSSAAGGVMPALSTSVTIGYDTPWRQVEALLLGAATQTPGVRVTPPPHVWRTALEDYYVKYVLLVTPDDPCHRMDLLDRLHVRILDAFNEHGVQIMSPHYVLDPDTPKVVPPGQFYAAPASPRAALVGEPAAQAAQQS